MDNDKKQPSKTDKESVYNSDVTKEDLEILGDKQKNLRTDGGEDTQLLNRERPVDFEGEDLDVPGRTLPEDRTKKKLKDEENQLYSQGGPDNDNLEENHDDL